MNDFDILPVFSSTRPNIIAYVVSGLRFHLIVCLMFK